MIVSLDYWDETKGCNVRDAREFPCAPRKGEWVTLKGIRRIVRKVEFKEFAGGEIGVIVLIDKES